MILPRLKHVGKHHWASWLFLYGPAVDQVLASEDADHAVMWMLTDNQGTIRDVVSRASGGGYYTSLVDHIYRWYRDRL